MSQQRILREVKQRIDQNLKQGQSLTCLQLDSIVIRQISKQLKSLLQQYPLIQYLTMNDCQLTSLVNFPKLDNLSILQLSNNQIQDDELFHLLKCSHISHLMIDQNRLRNIQKISVLRQLPNLQQLQIAGNRIGDTQFYREELFDRIPDLKIIDCHDKWGNIAINSQSQEEEEGHKGGNGNVINMEHGLTLMRHQQEKGLLSFLDQFKQQQQDEDISEQSSSQPYHQNQPVFAIHDSRKQHFNNNNNNIDNTTVPSSANSLNNNQESITNNNCHTHLNNNKTDSLLTNLMNNSITGSKRIKKQQHNYQFEQNHYDCHQIKQSSKVSNKKTSLIQQQSNSPDQCFLPFKRLQSEEYEE